MDNLTKTQTQLVDELSVETAMALLPVNIGMFVLMVVGLIGNMAVCKFYRLHSKSTPITELIISLAIIDAANCAFIPKHIIDMCFSYKYSIKLLCRIDAYLTHILGLSSGFTVLTIAIFRYRMVCRPLLRQFSFRNAHITIILTAFAALCTSLPALMAVDVIQFNITLSSGEIVKVYDCNKDPTSLEFMHIAINAIHVFLFISATTLLIILYGRMGRKILDYSHKRNEMRGTSNVQLRNGSRGKKRFVTFFNTRKYNINANEFYVWVDIPTQDSFASVEGAGQLTMRKKRDATNVIAAKQTFMLFTISLILLIGYLPYTAISVYTTWMNIRFRRDIVTQMCMRSIVLGSALNPCVYGLFNGDFRTYVRNFICCCSKK